MYFEPVRSAVSTRATHSASVGAAVHSEKTAIPRSIARIAHFAWSGK